MSEFIKTDIFLSNFATRYKAERDVANFIAPPFKVNRASDKYLLYGKDSFRIYNNKVSGREVAKEITQDLSSATFNCEEYSLSRFVSNRSRDIADKPINLEMDAVRQLKEAQMIAREKRVVDIAGSASVITQTVNAGGDWNTVASGTPIADIRLGMSTIWTNSTKAANRIVIPMDVAIECIGTDEYRDYFKYSQAGKNDLFNIVSGLRNLGLEPMIAGMFGASTNEGGASDPAIESMWSDSVLIFYAEETPSLESRTLMYSPYTKMGEVRRIEGSVQQMQRGVLFDIHEEVDELLVDATCGYLITNTL